MHTWEELQRLGLTDALVHRALTLVSANYCSREQALIDLVFTLAAAKDAHAEAHQKLLARFPRSYSR